MQAIKNDFSAGMNLDDSPYRLQPNAYADALNVTKNAVSGSNDRVITNIVGNRIVGFTLPTGSNKVIGAIANNIRNKVVYFVWNSNGNHSILEYNNTSRTVVKLLEDVTDTDGDVVLGFTENQKINSINVYIRDLEGDLYSFLGSLGRPTQFNVESLRSGVYSAITRSILDVAKEPPLSPPTSLFVNDTSVRANGFRKKLPRFAYRYVYDDFEKSSYSPIGSIPLPQNILDDTYTSVITNNNAVDISFLNGKENVLKVELIMSLSEASNSFNDFVTIKTFNAKNYDPDEVISYRFYNDGTYPTIDITESPIVHLYDYVPRKANAQEMPNGNVLLYGGITEGYDRDLVPNVTITVNTIAAGGGNPTGSLSVAITTPVNTKAVFSGSPAVGTIVNIKVKNTGSGIISTPVSYTTILGDTSATVATILSGMTGVGILNIINPNPSEIRITIASGYTFETIEIVSPSVSSQTNSISTFPFSISRQIGLVYFDKKGVTNGVLYNSQFVTPQYAEDGSQAVLLPYLNTKIYHVPPVWAYSYQWVMTKENTSFIYWYTVDVNTTESSFIYFDVSNFPLNQKKSPTTTSVLSYTFQDGDRMRLIRRDSDNTVYNDTYDAQVEGMVVDPVINGVQKTGTFLKIKKVSPLSSVDYTSKNFVIQIYRPSQQPSGGEANQQVFYEFSQQFAILDPTLTTRYHAGRTTDQDILANIPAESDFYNGDAYFRLRAIVLTETGAASYNVLDKNFVDIYNSAVNDIDGRPSIIDENAREAYYPTLVRFGQAYQANTNINGLNRFFPNNFDEYDSSYGDIMRLKSRDRYVHVFQKLKVGNVPIYNQISKNADGTTLNVVTDRLINPIQYYVGNFGIGEHAESLISHNFADYFSTSITGTICRLSSDGVKPISVMYKTNSWATEQLPLRVGNFKCYGAFDQKLSNFILAIEATSGSPAQSLIYNEETNSFDSFVSLFPEYMATLGNLLIAFKDGQLWTHDSTVYNNFFGIQYESTITPIFNEGRGVKTFMAIEEEANTIWDIPEIETSINSYGTTPQQSNLVSNDFKDIEGRYCAAFLRDSNSIGGINAGDSLKGDWIKLKLRNQNSDKLVSLNTLSMRLIDSPLNNR